MGFLLALQFLTTIPLKIRKAQAHDIAESAAYFPLVGLFLGLILALLSHLLSNFGFPPFAANIILIVLLIILTGGLHLDGLADTADALFSGKTKDEMLAIMRDPHIGVMGVLTLISVILLKFAFLSSINLSLKPVSLILMCTQSRWTQVYAINSYPYARQEGKAKTFIEGINKRIFIMATLFTLICTILAWQLKGLLVLIIVVICSRLIAKFFYKKINGITGDTIGAMNELIEVIILISISLLERSGP